MLIRILPALALLLIGTTACSGTDNRNDAAPTPETTPTTTVTASVSRCGQDWRPAEAGEQTIRLANVDSRAGEVQLVGQDRRHRGLIFGQVEPFGPGTTVELHVRLGPGRYALRCLFEDEAAVLGPVVEVRGSGPAGPGLDPVTDADLIRPAQRYTTWVTRQIPGLVAETRELASALRAGDVTSARRAWLRAHLRYERLGAAYDAFGERDADINGLPYGLPRGVRSSRWRGFHAIEHGLWRAAPDFDALAAEADTLAGSEQRLRAELTRNQVDPATLAIRAHEISENVLQLQLTGTDDFGSHTSLDTAAAELDGTLVVLRLVRPLLRPRLPSTGRLIRHVRAALRLVRDRAPHERLDAAISGLCEELAPVAATLEPRRTS